MRIHDINRTYLWLKYIFGVVCLLAFPFLLFPSFSHPISFVPYAVYVLALFVLNQRLDQDRLSWPWLVFCVCVPIIGFLVSFGAMEKAVTSANRRHGTSL
jgi:hypothetical protein